MRGSACSNRSECRRTAARTARTLSTGARPLSGGLSVPPHPPISTGNALGVGALPSADEPPRTVHRGWRAGGRTHISHRPDRAVVAVPTPSGGWPVHRSFEIVYHDIDVLGHLNHAAYFPFMESLRCDYYLGLLGTTDPARLDIILAEAGCRYLAPVRFGDRLIGEVAPARPIGRTSFTLLYRFRNLRDGVVCARGRTVVVCYDYATARKREIPPDRRLALERDAIDPLAEGWNPRS